MNRPDTTRPGSRIGKIVFALFGIGMLSFGIFEGVSTHRFLNRAIPVTGRVVAAPGQTGDMSSAHPTIEIMPPGGQAIRYRQNGMGGRKIGTELPVLYDPAGRDVPVVRGFWTLWFPIVGPILLGLAMIVAAATCEFELRWGRY